MNREEAGRVLRSLALGLSTDLEGVRRLLERVSVHEEHELLRDLLVEEGAAAILDRAVS